MAILRRGKVVSVPIETPEVGMQILWITPKNGLADTHHIGKIFSIEGDRAFIEEFGHSVKLSELKTLVMNYMDGTVNKIIPIKYSWDYAIEKNIIDSCEEVDFHRWTGCKIDDRTIDEMIAGVTRPLIESPIEFAKFLIVDEKFLEILKKEREEKRKSLEEFVKKIKGRDDSEHSED